MVTMVLMACLVQMDLKEHRETKELLDFPEYPDQT